MEEPPYFCISTVSALHWNLVSLDVIHKSLPSDEVESTLFSDYVRELPLGMSVGYRTHARDTQANLGER